MKGLLFFKVGRGKNVRFLSAREEGGGKDSPLSAYRTARMPAPFTSESGRNNLNYIGLQKRKKEGGKSLTLIYRGYTTLSKTGNCTISISLSIGYR